MKSILHTEDFIATNLPKELPPMDVKPVEDGGVLERFFKVREEFPDEVTVLEPKKSADYPAILSRTFYIAPTGDDKGDGSEGAPFATLGRAISAMEGKPGARIVFRGGTYTLSESFKVDGENKLGTKEAPLFIEAYEGETPILTAAYTLCGADFHAVTEENIGAEMFSRFNTFIPNNTDNIYVADLPSLGFTPEMYSKITSKGEPLLYIDGKLRTLARYPNTNPERLPALTSDADVLKQGRIEAIASIFYKDHKDEDDGFKIRIVRENAFYDHISRWKSVPDMWGNLQLYAEWTGGRFPVTFKQDDGDSFILESDANTNWGVRYNKECKSFYFNIAEELDAEGEWYLDRQTGKLYIWQDAPLAPDVEVAFVSKDVHLFDLKNMTNTVIDGLHFWGTLGSAIYMEDSDSVMIQRCVVHDVGKIAIDIKRTRNSAVIHMDMYRTTEWMISFDGHNDRKNMIPDRNLIQNCHFHHCRKPFTVTTRGVLFCVSHNLFDTHAIMYLTNAMESIYEYNEFRNGIQGVMDMGPVYCSNFNPKGQHIRYNYFNDINFSHCGIYTDDLSSDNYVYGNIFVYARVRPHLDCGLGMHIHCGSQNVAYNNVFVNAGAAGIKDAVNYCVKNVRDKDGNKMNIRHRIYKQQEVIEADDVYWGGSMSGRWEPMTEYAKDFFYDMCDGEAYRRRFPNVIMWYDELFKHMKNREALGEAYSATEANWTWEEQEGTKYPWGNQPLADFLDSQPDDTRHIYLRSATYNALLNNVFIGCEKDIEMFSRWNVMTTMVRDNYGYDRESPYYEMALSGDIAPLAKAETWKDTVPNFEALHFEKMGLCR